MHAQALMGEGTNTCCDNVPLEFRFKRLPACLRCSRGWLGCQSRASKQPHPSAGAGANAGKGARIAQGAGETDSSTAPCASGLRATARHERGNLSPEHVQLSGTMAAQVISGRRGRRRLRPWAEPSTTMCGTDFGRPNSRVARAAQIGARIDGPVHGKQGRPARPALGEKRLKRLEKTADSTTDRKRLQDHGPAETQQNKSALGEGKPRGNKAHRSGVGENGSQADLHKLHRIGSATIFLSSADACHESRPRASTLPNSTVPQPATRMIVQVRGDNQAATSHPLTIGVRQKAPRLRLGRH